MKKLPDGKVVAKMATHGPYATVDVELQYTPAHGVGYCIPGFVTTKYVPVLKLSVPEMSNAISHSINRHDSMFARWRIIRKACMLLMTQDEDGNQVRCECGAESCSTTHSHWCPVRRLLTDVESED